MIFPKALASLAFSALLLCSSSSAAPSPGGGPDIPLFQFNRRDDSGSSTNGTTTNATSQVMEPVVPPTVDGSKLSTLSLNKNILLAWAGSPEDPNSGSNSKHKLLKRDAGVFSQANFTFRYPTVPLDHSDYVSGISCSSGSLTATLTAAAYTFAKKSWKTNSKVVFVTAVDGCGTDNENELFLATSITFSDSKKTFTAKGSPTTYKDSGAHFNLKLGDVPTTTKLKRANNKRDMFETRPLHRRDESKPLSLGLYLSDFIGSTTDAPWENAALLLKISKELGKKDKNESWKKGEIASKDGHHKRLARYAPAEGSDITAIAVRSTNTALAVRKAKTEKEFGVAFYCVECGITGTFSAYSEFDVDILTFSVNTAQVGLKAQIKLGLYIGIEAYVLYEKTWEYLIARIILYQLGIPKLIDIGPYISSSVEFKAGISATGTLLIGTGVEWNKIDIMFDLKDFSNSHATGFTPAFVPRAEVSGELKIEASLGFPFKFGVGVFVLVDVWEADVSIVETPAIVTEGIFQVSAVVAPDGTIKHDINGGCYGIAWNIHFTNTLQGVIHVDDVGELAWNLVKPWESDPIAEFCIGYTDDGMKGDDDDGIPDSKGKAGGMTGNGLASGGTGLSGGNSGGTKTTNPKCKTTPAITNPKVPGSATCNQRVPQAGVFDQYRVGKDPKDVKNQYECGNYCLLSTKCKSFGWDTRWNKCYMFSDVYKSLGILTKSAKPDLYFYDRDCFVKCS